MRRRPIEFWWISAFALFQSILVWRVQESAAPADRLVLGGYAIAFLASALLLMLFSPAGRAAALALLSVEALNQIQILVAEPSPGWLVRVPVSLVFAAFCGWMIVYLGSASTRRLACGLFTVSRAALADFHLRDLCELGLCAGAGCLAARLGADLPAAGCIGIVCYIAYGLLLEEKLRRRWRILFPRAEAGFPKADAGCWKAACRALARQDVAAARRFLSETSNEAREHPAGRLLRRVIEWRALLEDFPMDGQGCLRRLAFDHDWQPNALDRNRLAEYVQRVPLEDITALLGERAELMRGLVAAGLDSRSFFREQADCYLARITGETFPFNTPESWAAWWEQSGADWSGDGGAVSLAARMLRNDAGEAAHALAVRAAGRAEEPLLKEVTAQMLFLNAMQKAMREHRSVEPFIKQPQRLLLVPELADAVGLLHADSHWLQNLNMTLAAASRRVHLRVPLVDYIGRLWERYPNELGGDMPWVLKTLTDKNFGVLRARARFQAWWPAARESFQRHDRAVTAGLAAYNEGEDALAEEAFRSALAEQPGELSSRYNLALCLMRRQAHAEAARLVRELTRLEPKESYWWLVLGEMLRGTNRSADAHAAFRRAGELGAAAPKVAFYRGLTFGRDQRDADAIRQLDCVLGRNPPAAKIDALVSALESEGLWKLAGHYREKSFQQGLLGGDSGELEGGEELSA